MALPWFAFSIEFYANIQGNVDGLPLVVSKQTLGLILDGGITAWNDTRLAADNTWLTELQASEADLAIKVRLTPHTSPCCTRYWWCSVDSQCTS